MKGSDEWRREESLRVQRWRSERVEECGRACGLVCGGNYVEILRPERRRAQDDTLFFTRAMKPQKRVIGCVWVGFVCLDFYFYGYMRMTRCSLRVR